MKKIVVFTVFIINCFSIFASELVSPLYFKNYRGNYVLNNTIIDGNDKSLISENEDLVFSYKNIGEAFDLNGQVVVDLFVEFDVRDVSLEVALYKVDSDGNELLLNNSVPRIQVKRNQKVNRVYFKTAKINETFENGEILIVKIRQNILGKIFNLTKLHHSPKYPSKILVPADFAFN